MIILCHPIWRMSLRSHRDGSKRQNHRESRQQIHHVSLQWIAKWYVISKISCRSHLCHRIQCQTEDGKELARVCLIDYASGIVVYDKLVNPQKPVIDYLTR